MRYTRHLSLFILALLVSPLLAVSTSVANVAGPDETSYRAQTRVARISLLRGDVQLRRAGSNEWESAAVNLPLVEGDQIATGRDARVEIQIDAHNFVRAYENSLLSIITLRSEGVALSLAEGTATLRLARFDKDREYFEMDAPQTTVAAEKRGLYRVDAGRKQNESGEVRITVRDGGRARIYSETSGFTLRDGRTARLFFQGEDGGDWEMTSASSLDNWDEWIEQREETLAQNLRYERRERYYDSGVWGAEELDSYGDWVNAGSYGYVWRPHVTVINNYYNWTPYRYGSWRWCPPYGWTWIPAESWGWAPYHYGRWVHYNGAWCWSPRNYYNYGHSWWHPSLVVFVTINNNYGQQVCWYPLPPRHPDPVYTNTTAGTLNGVNLDTQAANKGRLLGSTPKGGGKPLLNDPAYLNAVTSVPVKDFGSIKPTGKPAPPSLAQEVIRSEPVAVNSLPVRSPKTVPGGGNLINNSNDAPTRRPRGGDGGALLSERPTGAAVRKPGVALDTELRPRLRDGREPISTQEPSTGGVKGGRDTGAVTRPSRPTGTLTIERPAPTGDNETAPGTRPTRPSAPLIRDGDSSSQETESQPVRPRRPPAPSRPEAIQPPPSELPDRQPRRPERREEPAPVRPEPVRPPRQEPVRQPPPPPQPMPDRPQRQQPPPPPPPPPPAKSEEAPPLSEGKRGRG